MSDVPGEILLEILSRLPVVSLLRFRCVSKSWKCLIDSNEFIRHHLNQTNSNLNIILESLQLYSADFDLLNETNQVDFQQLTPPLFPTKSGKVMVLGSCHGLLVLSNENFLGSRNSPNSTTILWNPSVKRFHKLPYECSECRRIIKYISYGFGYDGVSDDYKLVRILHSCDSWGDDDDDDDDIVVKVYSLKSDSWTRIPDFPYKITIGPVEFANGALHWQSDNAPSLVIAFDLGTYKFNLVPLPEFAVHNCTTDMFVFHGCFCFMIDDNVNKKTDFWVMKVYGVQESWSLLFTCKAF